MKIHQTKDPKKKNLCLELCRRCLRRSWVREIWVHVGVSNLGFLICCSCICFSFVVQICCSFVFLLICWLFLWVSILVFFVFLFSCSTVCWNLFMKLESLKLKFQVDFFPHQIQPLTNRDLKTWVLFWNLSFRHSRC